MKNEIVSVEWLKDNLALDNLILLDASPKSNVNMNNSALGELCIPTARRFNIKEKFTNLESEFPNTVPSSIQFERECQALGINQDSVIVVYDNLGIYTSPRVWWLFKMMGHEDVSVLNGGLPEWVKMGFETVDKSSIDHDFDKGNFKSENDDELVISHESVCENIESNKFILIDARSEGRFNGTQEEPRKNLKSGNIPKSVNIPFQTLLEEGKFISTERLKTIFDQKVGGENKLVFTCGSGLTACIVMLASEIAFQKSRYLFDGSWTEYATKQKLLK